MQLLIFYLSFDLLKRKKKLIQTHKRPSLISQNVEEIYFQQNLSIFKCLNILKLINIDFNIFKFNYKTKYIFNLFTINKKNQLSKF